MLTKRLSIRSNLVYQRQALFLFLFSLLSHPVDALAIPPLALRLTRRDGSTNHRATRNEVVAALLTIIFLIILVSYGIWWLVSTATRVITGTVTSSSYGSGSSSTSGTSVLDMWQSPAVRFMRFAAPGAPPGPRIRNIRGERVIVHEVHPPGAGPG